MNSNIINLPAVRSAGNLPAVRDIDDPDLYVNYLEYDPRLADWRQRRDGRRDDYYRAVARRRADSERLMQNVSTVAMFSMLGVTVLGGLIGQI